MNTNKLQIPKAPTKPPQAPSLQPTENQQPEVSQNPFNTTPPPQPQQDFQTPPPQTPPPIEPVKRNAVEERFQKSSKSRRLEEAQSSQERPSQEQSSQNIPTQDFQEELISEQTQQVEDVVQQETASPQPQKPQTNTFKERVLFILLAMFFIWFLITVLTSGVKNVTDGFNPVDKTNNFLRNFESNLNVEERLDTIMEWGGK